MKSQSSWECIDGKTGVISDVWWKLLKDNVQSGETCRSCCYIDNTTMSKKDSCKPTQPTVLKNDRCAPEVKQAVCRKDWLLDSMTSTPQPKVGGDVQCDPKWVGFHKSDQEKFCYLFVDHKVTRAAAEEHCSELGGYLVSILDQFESMWVVTNILDCCTAWIGFEYTNDQDLCTDPNLPSYFWEWNWSDIATHPTYTCPKFRNWNPDDPKSNSTYINGVSGDKVKLCASMGQGGYWNSELCDRRLPFICKKQGR